MNDRWQSLSALIWTTISFTVCFACWVMNGVLVTYLVSTGIRDFDGSQVGWLLAAPVLAGAVSRVPLGMLTDRYGGRIVFLFLMLAAAVPLYLLSHAESYAGFLLASLGFGLTGGGFAVGVGYISLWFGNMRQGLALAIFGTGTVGAVLTTAFAPQLLSWFTQGGAEPDGWRLLPRTYAGILVVTAIAAYLFTRHRVSAEAAKIPLSARVALLRNVMVWRFGFYYMFVFGSFMAIAQWIVPYSVNVYGISIAQAGLLAAAFVLPSAIVRVTGGWLSDLFGARPVMYWVFLICVISCLLLSVPRMEIDSRGEGIVAGRAGTVVSVTPNAIRVGHRDYRLKSPPEALPSKTDTGGMVLPRVTRWQEAAVIEGQTVARRELIARGVTRVYYPANVWFFAILVFVFGVATGVGKAGVYKFIPDQFPDAVGAVGGIVGLAGAMGGFLFPPVFGYLLRVTGLWSSCWLLLTVVSLACLVWMHVAVRRLVREEKL